MSDDNIALEILIEYSDQELLELAKSKGIDTDYKSRGKLICELLNLEEGV